MDSPSVDSSIARGAPSSDTSSRKPLGKSHPLEGFGHPADFTAATVLVVSRALADSGLVRALALLISVALRSARQAGHAPALVIVRLAIRRFVQVASKVSIP